MSPSRSYPSRRSVLAAGAAAALAGCSGFPTTVSSAPQIDCSPADYSWPAYGYDPGRTGRASDRDLPPADADAARLFQTGTRRDGGGSVDAPPVVGDGRIYAAGDVRVAARDLETGERLWETDPEDGVSTSPALGCGSVYVATLNETLALDAEDGAILWRSDARGGGGPSTSPVAVDDTVFVGGGGVTALDAETGDERWHAATEHSAHGFAVGDRIYVGAGSNGAGEVTAFTRDGDEWWRVTDVGPVYATPTVADGTVYAVSKTGTLTALRGADGEVLWTASIPSGVYEPPAVADGRVFVGAGNGRRASAFDAETGERRWRFETGVSQGAPTVVGDRVLATGANTGVHALDVATGDRTGHWRVPSVGSAPVVAGGRLLYRAWNVSEVFVVG